MRKKTTSALGTEVVLLYFLRESRDPVSRKLSLGVLDGGLGGSEACDRNAER